jgi:hypothetical protein
MKIQRCFYATVALAAVLPGCGRDEVWDAPADAAAVQHLADAAVVIDATANRVLVLGVDKSFALAPTSLPIGHGYAASATTTDGKSLLVLSRGDVPRRKAPNDQLPRLSLIVSGDKPAVKETFGLSDPLSGLSVDPEGRYAIVFPSAADTAFVANPNELSIVDLSTSPSDTNPLPLTLRSFGGRPQSFTFTGDLDIAGHARRLLCVLTDRDIGIIDLSVPEKGDITVPLSSTGQRPEPTQIVVSNGSPSVDDARLAVRLVGDPNIILVDLPPVPAADAATSAHDFKPSPNIVFAGGMPSDIAFVNTDGGLRLAALVPEKSQLGLIDPSTGITTSVDLGGKFETMSLVTDIVGPTQSGADVALMWSSQSPEIAFVALGSTVGKPYKSVERLTLETPLSRVLDVPAPNQQLKILVGSLGKTFYVLDLVARTASPLLANSPYGSDAQLTLSPDGRGAWFFSASNPDVAWLDLGTLHPKNLQLSDAVFDVADVSRRGGGRALLALRHTDGFGLTVIDGDNPSVETSVDYPRVLLGELP